MATFSSIFPKLELQEKFPNLVFEEYTLKNIREAQQAAPLMFYSTGMCVWDRIVQKHPGIDRYAMARHFNNNSPEIMRHIGNFLGIKVIKDLYFCRAGVSIENKDHTVGQVFLAEVYPNDVHLCDIEFSDPSQPLQAEDKKFPFQEYKGLGLFKEFLIKLERLAKEKECDAITLLTASVDHYNYFLKFGFLPSQSIEAKKALISAGGAGMSMYKPVS